MSMFKLQPAKSTSSWFWDKAVGYWSLEFMYWLRCFAFKYIVLSTLSHQLTDIHLYETDTQSGHLSTKMMDFIIIVFIILLLAGKNINSSSWLVSQYYKGHH